MVPFERRLENGLCDELLKSPLFKRLNRDPEVFLAIRDNRVDFYHGGGRLFSFDGSFSTHIKYASVYDAGRRNYVCESDLADLRPIRAFDDDWAYERMKENCRLYAGIEAAGISEIYNRYSYRNDSSVVVLDVEIAFSTKHDSAESDQALQSKTHERVDLLLFHTKQKTLRFVEAKHFSNPELWAKPGKNPCVLDQLRGYEKVLCRRQDEIREQYRRYVELVNRLLDRSLPAPERIDEHVPLLVFGFGADEKTGRLGKLKLGLTGVKRYAKGNATQMSAEVIWRETT